MFALTFTQGVWLLPRRSITTNVTKPDLRTRRKRFKSVVMPAPLIWEDGSEILFLPSLVISGM